MKFYVERSKKWLYFEVAKKVFSSNEILLEKEKKNNIFWRQDDIFHQK